MSALVFAALAPFLAVSRLRRSAKDDSFQCPRRILILEPWGLGDLVLATAVIAPLRRAFPRARIVFLCRRQWAFVLPPGVEFVECPVPWTAFRGKYRIWRWPWRRIWRGLLVLRARRFDWILDARGDPRNHLLSWLIGARRRVGWRTAGCAYLLTDAIDVPPRRRHRIEDWKAVLNAMGVAADDMKPHVRGASSPRKTISSPPLIGVHAGAAQPVRRWPAASFAVLIRRLIERWGARCLVFISPDGQGMNLIGHAPVEGCRVEGQDLIDQLSQLDLFIGNDSGVGHLAAALDVPVVSLFGPGDPHHMRPWGRHVTVVSLPDVFCRPCWDACRFPRPWCLEDLSVDHVDSVVDNVLQAIIHNRQGGAEVGVSDREKGVRS